MFTNTNWKPLVKSILEVAENTYYSLNPNGNSEEYMDFIVDYLCKVPEDLITDDVEAVEEVKDKLKGLNGQLGMTKYARPLSLKFDGELVAIYNKDSDGKWIRIDNSIAKIISGPNERCQDAFKLVSSGEWYNLKDYLEAFGCKFHERCHMRFLRNEKLSVEKVKKNFDSFNTIEDIQNYKSLKTY